MHVWLSGPTGAGKSSLAEIFRRLRFAIVQENLPGDRFCNFASHPSKYCAQLQEDIMRSRFEQWRALSGLSRVIFDRSVDEDFHIFCRMHFDAGFLTDRQYDRLRELSQELQSAMPAPDLIVFLWPDRRTISDRVTTNSHPLPIVNNLDCQLSLYTQWLADKKEEIIRIDNSGCRLQTLQDLIFIGER